MGSDSHCALVPLTK